MVLRYEDLVQEPDGTRSAIASFLGLPPRQSADDGEPSEYTRIIMPWEAWKMRALAPVTTARVDVWRELLTPSQSLAVAAICRSEMKRFGYMVPEAAWWACYRRLRLPVRQHRRRWVFRRAARRMMREIDAVEL